MPDDTPSDETALATLAADSGPNLATAPFTWKTLHAISRTDFVPKELRGKPAAILACVMYGREWGLGPMESLQLIDMLPSGPSAAAQLLVAKVFAAGHEIYPKEITPTSATAVAMRRLPDGSTREREFTFTIEDAQRAGLAGKDNFKHYPGPMLYWRAATQLIRFVFPDVLGPSKGYSPDELGSDTWTPPAEVLDAADVVVEPSEIVEVVWDATALIEGELIAGHTENAPTLTQAEAMEPEPGADTAVQELAGEIVEPPVEDFEARLVGYVTGWLGGDRKAAEMEVTRVVKGRRLDAKLANDLYGRLRKRLAPAGDAQPPLL